tara:strand:+ start:99841 stop:101136 length:1296 start_codon:yes stop_codon:yes gene_type:complete
MKSPYFVLLFLFLTLLYSCRKELSTTSMTNSLSKPNILLIIADDMGKDATAGFTEGLIKPNTPKIDELKNTGLSFTNAWVNPTCSPTRATIITGKYGFRTGVKWAGDILPANEKVLQKYINDNTNNAYSTALIGKWHLSGNAPNPTPEKFGIDYYAGVASGAVTDYFNWTLTEDGKSTIQSDYVTEHLTNLAIDWIGNQEKPWFLWMAYNAPHTPFHTPPTQMHSQGTLPEYQTGMDATPYYLAAIEAMDYQIDRLISAMTPEQLANTVIIFIGDNGTPNQVAQYPYSKKTAKGTLYQGGVNVPLFITGKGVLRTGMDENLICGTDLFATIANLAGVAVSEIHDSKSFLPLLSNSGTIRSFQYSEMKFSTNDLWAIRDRTYKLIVSADGTQEMFNLTSDPYEKTNLLVGTLTQVQQKAKADLELEITRIRQ